MNEFGSLAQALAAGGLLGAMFFGGLWWTVIKGLASERPALWFFVSSQVRTVIALGGFYFIGSEHWQRWLVCLLGFVLARAIVKWLTRSTSVQRNARAPGNSYAS